MSPPSIQELLDEAEINAVVELSPGDYGPVELRRPVVLNAHGATFWAVGEHPAVRISASGVCLQNATLRAAPNAAPSVVLEITPAVHPTLQSVRVHGGISGLDPEEDKWVLPQRLDGGDLRAPISHFALELGASGAARLVSRVSGIEFDPPHLQAGFTEVKMRIRDVSQDSILVGDVELITAHITRIIPFSARVAQFEPGLASAPIKTLFRVPDARRPTPSAASPPQATSPQPAPVQPPFVVPPPSPLVPEPTAVVAISPPAPTASPVASPSSKPQLPQQPVIAAVPDPMPPQESPWAGPMHSLVPLPPPPDVPADKSLSDLFALFNASAQAAAIPAKPSPIPPPTVGKLFGEQPTEVPETLARNAPISQSAPQSDGLSPLFNNWQASNSPSPSHARRLPVYMLLDCSASLKGDPIEAVRHGINLLHSNLMGDPSAVECACMSIITFDSDARQVVPLTDIAKFNAPFLSTSDSEDTRLGEALKLLRQCINREVRKGGAGGKGDWMPLVFILTDGPATDRKEFARQASQFRSDSSIANIVAVACGDAANQKQLHTLTDTVLQLKDMSSDNFATFFKWVSVPQPEATRHP